MTNAIIFLNVPYAQKDEAKALGARWNAAEKKWYITADKDLSIFAKWQADAQPTTPLAASNSQTEVKGATKKADGQSITSPSIKNFVAYDGDAPPWA